MNININIKTNTNIDHHSSGNSIFYVVRHISVDFDDFELQYEIYHLTDDHAKI